MINHAWIVNLREAGLSVLDAVSLRVPAAPRSFLHQLAGKQRILLNGSVAEETAAVTAGDKISLRPSARLDQLVHASRLSPPQVLYEDQLCIVLNKPAGLMTHPAGGHDSDLLTDLRTFLRLRRETFQVSPAHRLDIGTSGPVLFGKGRAAISALGKMLMAGEARKEYLALVSGQPPESGTLETSIQVFGKDKDSQTRYRCLATAPGHALLELELITGRRHQIRQQLAEAGWPIVGDQRYRGESMPGLTRPFLHCLRLTFTSPEDNRTVKIEIPPPDDLTRQLASLGFA